MISSSNLTCKSKVTSAITISSDCKAIVGLHLGKHEVIINDSGYTATATVTVIPQVKTLASQGAGALYHLVVTPTGNLLAWGRNYFASLWQGADSQDSYLPICVKNTAGTDKLANIVSASTGADTAMALTEEGEVFFWGDSNNPTRPSYIRNAANTGNLKNIVQGSAGHRNFAALADDGTVYT